MSLSKQTQKLRFDVIRLFKQITIGLFFMSFCFFCIILFVFHQKTLNYKVMEVESGAVKNVSSLSSREKSFEDYSYIGEKEIFGFPYSKSLKKKSEQLAPEANIKPDPVFVSFNRDYKLVGVILAHQSKAVIEDVKNKETVFLSVGDLLNGATLKEIKKGAALFSYKGKDLKLEQ